MPPTGVNRHSFDAFTVHLLERVQLCVWMSHVQWCHACTRTLFIYHEWTACQGSGGRKETESMSFPLLSSCIQFNSHITEDISSRERAEPRYLLRCIFDSALRMGFAPIDSKMYVGIATIGPSGSAHYFYTINITQARVDAVADSQIPAQENYRRALRSSSCKMSTISCETVC